MKLVMQQFAAIEGFTRRGELLGMFHWCNDGVTSKNHHIITEDMDVESLYQKLYFHKGNKKIFDALYQKVTQ